MVFYCTNIIRCTCINIKWSKYKTYEKTRTITRNRKEKVKLNNIIKTHAFLLFYELSLYSFFFSLISIVFDTFFFLAILCSNRIKKAEKFAKQCIQKFIRYCIESVLAYILYICACVRMKIERAISKGCSFYFLSISLIIQ